MRKQHDREELMVTTVVEEIICNNCGKSFKPIQLAGSLYYSPQVHDFEVKFKYESKYDGEKWIFELCDDCIESIVKSFKHAPEIKDR